MEKRRYIYRAAALICTLGICLCTLLAPQSVSAATAAQLRQKVVSVAQGEVGYTPSTANVTKYGTWYGTQGAWCTMFAIWCVDQADQAMGTRMYGSIVPSGGSCVSMRSWFINSSVSSYHARSSSYTPQTGDFIFFDWNGDGSSQHVGIVTSATSSTVYTVEGNSSGKVKANSYARSNSSIMGYGAPNYSQSAGGSSSGSGGSSSASQDKSVAAYQVSVNTETLNVRSTPSTSGTLLTTVSRGTALNVSATNGDWLKVSFTKSGSTVTGYVSGAYVTKMDTSSSSSASSNTSGTTEASASQAVAAASSSTASAAASAGTDEAVPTGLYVYAETDQLEVGEKVRLNYELKPAGTEAEVTYETDSDLIQLSRDGEIEAMAPGEATVVVTADTVTRSYTFYITGEPAAQADGADQTESDLEPDTEGAEPVAAIAGGDVPRQQALAADTDDNLDLKLTFIASGACVIGAVGCIPVIRKRRRSQLVTLGERIKQLKK